MSQAGFITITSSMLPPDVPTSFVTDSGTAIPVANTLNIFGTTVAAGSIPFQFTGLGDTVTGEIQLSQAIAATDATKVGLASFNSAQFSVDANGFVSSLGGGGSITLTGNSGVATPAASNINIVTANSTVKFVGAGATLTQDFSLSNLCLGTSLPSITTGIANCTFGQSCAPLMTTGSTNSFYGNFCASNIQQGSSNSAFGASSLSAFNFLSNTVTGNSAFGWSSLGALQTGTFNTACGYRSLNGVLTGSRNCALGNDSGISYTTSESSNIVIRNSGTILDNNTIRIGTQGAGAGQQNRCFIAGIAGVTVSNTQAVTIDSTTGQLGVTAVPTSITWSQVGGSGTSVKNTGEFVNAAVTRTLPVSAGLADGDLFIYICTTAGALVIQSVGSQRIRLGNILSAAAGTATSTAIGDSIELRFNATDGFFYCCGGPQGTWTIT